MRPTRPASPSPAPTGADGAPTAAKGSERGRDDFKAKVKVELAQRVGYLCSNPNCQRSTVGPRRGEPGANNVGVAAHIKAASPGGARYDENQTSEERSHADNGIWLCEVHAHLIDHDANEFTVELLQKWKREAEERAFQQLLSGRGPAAVYSAAEELLDELRGLRAQLGLSQESDLESVRAAVSAASLVQVEAFEGTSRWPRHPVELELAVEDDRQAGSVTLPRFPQVLLAAQRIVILSAPGTGKTTTLLQLARALLAVDQVPVFVPLGEWAESTSDLFEWVAGRNGFARLTANHLKFLAHHGELALLLDGWNEVPGGGRRRLIIELSALQRDFPLMNVVTSSRREALDVPVAGRRLSVLALTEDQQVEIARAMRGEEGVSILDAAWRTAGLRDLVTVPLYLRSLLEISTSGALPETKEEVLRLMVRAHEADPANADLFHRVLMGEQQGFLTEIAVAAQEFGTTALPVREAIAAVARTNRGFIEEGLTANPPNARVVLDTLVAGHSLVHGDGATYGFQHQQIQEWFASRNLEAALRAEEGNLALGHPLVTSRLNDRGWGETVLFTCERMSRSDDEGAGIVADLIRLLLRMDPVFAAQVVRRSASSVWTLVGDEVLGFANAWHRPGHPDLAVGFMITTGRPEFADVVWRLVANPDSQIQMRTMRLVSRFNPAVLGDRLLRDYAGLPEGTRETFAVELAFHGDRAGIDAAHALALTEPSLDIRRRVFDGLSFRRATAQLEDLLRRSGDALAQQVAEHGHLDEVRDPALLDDLRRRQQEIIAVDPSVERRLARALESLPEAELPEVIETTLRDPTFSFRDRGEQVMAEAAARFPDPVANALLHRIENDLEMPFRPFAYLDTIVPADRGDIADMLLKGKLSKEASNYAIYVAGPGTVRQLVHRYLTANHKFLSDGVRTTAAYAPVGALSDVLEHTRASVFFEVLQEYAEGTSAEQIEALCRIISRLGPSRDHAVLRLSDVQRAAAVALMNGWGRQLLSENASRRDLGQLTWAMRRLPDPTQVPLLRAMLAADLACVRAARTAFEADRGDMTALQEMRNSHTMDYRVTLTSIGTPEAEDVLRDHLLDPEFGVEAGIGLQVIWLAQNEPRKEDEFPRWPDFERVAANRSRDRTISTSTAEAILAASEIARAEGTPQGLRRAIKLAAAAVLLPHGDRLAMFADLLAQDTDRYLKLELAQRMVVGGLIVSSAVVVDVLRQMIDQNGAQGRVAENDAAEFIRWLQLLAFSDQPMALLDGVDLVTSSVRLASWRIREVLSGLRYVPEVDRMALLRGLIQRFPKLTSEHQLYLAIPDPGGPTLELLLDIASGRLGSGRMGKGVWLDFPEQVFRDLPQDERNRLPERFAESQSNEEKAFLASMLLASDDHEIFLMLVGDPVGQVVIRRQSWSARQNQLYIRRSNGQDTSSYELIPRDISRLRKGLFGLTQSPDPEVAAFAADYLQDVDATRVAEGGFDIGPRHPDISTGLPWPNVSSD